MSRGMAGVMVLGLACGGLVPQGAGAQAREQCFGVAEAGRNDGIGADATPGGSAVDFQGDAWLWVPPGSCLTMPLPAQPDGTPRRGALEPLDRDRP